MTPRQIRKLERLGRRAPSREHRRLLAEAAGLYRNLRLDPVRNASLVKDDRRVHRQLGLIGRYLAYPGGVA